MITKKRVGLFVGIFTVILLIVLMFGLVSANPFTDFFKNIFSGPQFSPAESNLMAYYNFDADANDISGKGNNGVVTGATLVPGKFGNAYSFNGVNSYIKTEYTFPTTDFTYSFWANSPVVGGGTAGIGNRPFGAADGSLGKYGTSVIWGYKTSAGNYLWVVARQGANVNTYDINAIPPTQINTGWHFVTVTINSNSGATLYWDGVYLANNPLSKFIKTGGLNLTIGDEATGGAGGYNLLFNGTIDDVRVYNKALSATEVKELYNYVPVKITCGNGIIETGEQCDDGNINNGDGCSSTCQTEIPTQTCTDSDGGDNIYKKGTCKYNDNTFTDICEGDSVWEQNCDENNVCVDGNAPKNCPNGCQNGACIQATNQTYNNTCSGDVANGRNLSISCRGMDYVITGINVASNENNYLINGNLLNIPSDTTRGCFPLDSINCFYRTYLSCGTNNPCRVGFSLYSTDQSCYDDDGQNWYIKGTARVLSQSLSRTDTCVSGDNLIEYSCETSPQSLNYIVNHSIYCGYNSLCSNGACQPQNNQTNGSYISGCSYLNDDVKNMISSIESSNGTVVKQEGNKIFKGQYIILPGEEDGKSSIFEVTQIGNSSSSTASDDELIVRDVFTRDEIKAKATSEGTGMFTVLGKSFSYNYWGAATIPYEARQIDINFQHTTGNQKMSFENCASSGSICDNLISKVKTPSSFEDLGVKYALQWNNSWSNDWYVNGVPKTYINYNVGWRTFYNDKDYYLSYQVMVFDDPTFDAKTLLDQFTSYKVCKVESFWSADNKENKVYVCNYDIFRNQQITNDGSSYNFQEIFWTQGNVLVEAFVYDHKQLTNDEIAKISQQKMQDLINNLINNDMKYVDWKYFVVPYPLSRQIESAVSQCPSSIPSSECSASWNCKIEPVICPEYGYQTRTCIDFSSCNQPTREDRLYCSPGICSGCYVPRWLGYDNGDNTCIPYGIRITQESVNKYVDTLPEGVYGDPGSSFVMELKVISDVTAIMTISDDKGTNDTFYLSKGNIAEIIFPKGMMKEPFKIKVVDIVKKSGEGESYITFSPVEKSNAYCDIDGSIKKQKPSIEGQDWPKCQNNYECEGNICSSGQCLPIQQAMRDSGKVYQLIISILCKISNPISGEEYKQCVADFLGA